MAIEFGILRDGISTTHIGELRVETLEEVFWELDPLWEQIRWRTGTERDAFGQARFEGAELRIVAELSSGYPTAGLSEGAKVLVAEVSRLALHALGANKALTFFGI